MTIKAKIFENGDMQVNEEFIEIPQELVGGRNLVKNSNLFAIGSNANGINSSITAEGYLKIVTTSGNGNWHTGWYNNLSDIESQFQEGETFTISFTIKSDDTTSVPAIYIKSGMGYYSMSGVISGQFSTIYYTGQWKKANSMIPHIGWNGRVGTYYIKNWKIEKGNKSTPWTPAPEDLGLNIPMSIQNFDNPIQFNESSISSKELVEIPDILTSGRNILRNSKKFYIDGSDYRANISRTYVDGITTIKAIQTGAWNAYSWMQSSIVDSDFFKNISVGEEYTLSMKVKMFSTNPNSGVNITFDTRSPSTSIHSTSNVTYDTGGKWVDVKTTMKVSPRELQSQSLLLIRPTNNVSVTIGDTIEIKDIKLERGSKATPFNLALEDLGYDIPLYAKMGNRNLVKIPSTIADWTSTATRDRYKYSFSASSQGGLRINENIFEVDTDYVLSFDIKKISGNIVSLGGHSAFYKVKKIEFDGVTYSESLNWHIGIDKYPNDNLTHNVKIYMITSGVKSGDAHLYIQPNRYTGYNQTYSVEISNIKVEKGLTSTGWSPAPEDLGFNNLPNWIQNFNSNPLSVNPQGLSVNGDFSEYPNIVEDGLELWYDFKNLSNNSSSKSTAFDISGKLNNGQLVNFAFNSDSGYGKGIKFDGIDDYITCKNPLFKYPNLEQKWTVEFVAKIAPIETGARNIVDGIHTGLYQYANSRFLNYLNKGENDYYRYSKANVINHNKYQLYTFSFDNATASINIYIDSINVNDLNKTNKTSTPLPMSQDIMIGRYIDSEFLSFRIYNRMLTDDEVRHNYEVERARWGI